jgi:hypothetical protein
MADPQVSTPASRKGEEQREGERAETHNTNTHTIKTPSHLQMAAGTAIDEFDTLVKLKNKR